MTGKNHYAERLNRFQWATALFLVASLVFMVVRPGISTSNAAQPIKKQKREGEQIFRGLLFGEEGEVSAMFPQIWKRQEVVAQMKSPEKAKAWNAFKEKVIVSIRKKDPDFFKRFEDGIQSGDHFRIRDMLAESGKLISEVLSEKEKSNKSAAVRQAPISPPANGQAEPEARGAARITKASMSTAAKSSGAARNANANSSAETQCEGGICVTQDSAGIYVDDDPNSTVDPQEASAMACSAVAVCVLALAVAVWKWAVAVDVAAVAYVAAVVVAIWKWKYKYSYSYAELDTTQTLYQEMLVDTIAQQLAIQEYNIY